MIRDFMRKINRVSPRIMREVKAEFIAYQRELPAVLSVDRVSLKIAALHEEDSQD